MKKMRRAAVWHAIRDVRIEEVPQQSLGPSEVRVSVKAVGVCGSDAHLYYGEHDTDADFAPFILGHECAGEIVEVGSDVEPSRVGQRVAVDPTAPCGQCSFCLSGTYNLCSDVIFFAAVPHDGCLADDVVVTERQVHVLPDDMSYEAGAMLEPLSCALATARRLGVDVGDRVLITGAGPIGQMCVRVAGAFGAREIVVSDINEDRLQYAVLGGATELVDARERDLRDLGLFDIVFECSGITAVAEEAVATLGFRGRAALLGMGLGDRIAVDVLALQRREALITGVFRFANTYDGLPEFGNRLDLDVLVSHVFDLERVAEAIETTRENSHAMKVLVRP